MIHRRFDRQAGSVCVLAVVLLVVFAAIAAAFAGLTSMNVRKSGNLADQQRARLAAESGLAFATRLIRGVRLPSGTDSATVMAALGPAVAAEVDGTANLAGASVLYDNARVIVPRVVTDDGAFDVTIVRSADGQVSMRVCGLGHAARHGLSVALTLVADPQNTAFDYGIASMGPVVIGGNAEIRGMNELTEASVVSVAEQGVAIAVDGTAVVDGDLSSVGSDTSVTISGTPTIAGSQDPAVIAQHVHFGVPAPVFPEVDTDCFKALATTVIDHDTDTSQHGAVFENVVIKAGTNPTFASDVVLNGVVYVEAPNVVNFAAKVTLNGVLATEDTDLGIASCKVSFAGQVEAFGVDALPDDPQFQAVKALTGTFIAAPGFDINFAGQFTTINGTIAADRLTFSGQAAGTVQGSVIGLAEHPVSINGHVNISIDRSADDPGDAGLTLPVLMDVDPTTYCEIVIPEGA